MHKTKLFDFSARGRATVRCRQLVFPQMEELRMSFGLGNNSSCKIKVCDDTTLQHGPCRSVYMQCTSPGVPLAKGYVFHQCLLAKGQRYYFAVH